MTFGLQYALAATQLIVAHMCKQPLSAPLIPTALLAAAAATSLAPRSPSSSGSALTAAAAVALVSLAAYSIYAALVIRQICEFLGIKCLSIPLRSASVAPAAAAKAGGAKDFAAVGAAGSDVPSSIDGSSENSDGSSLRSSEEGDASTAARGAG